MIQSSLKRESKKDAEKYIRQQEEKRQKCITSQSRDGTEISETLESKRVGNLTSLQPSIFGRRVVVILQIQIMKKPAKITITTLKTI